MSSKDPIELLSEKTNEDIKSFMESLHEVDKNRLHSIIRKVIIEIAFKGKINNNK